MNVFHKFTSRSSRFKINSIGMLVLKGLSILISFLYVPLLLHTFSENNYGIWLTITSLLTWVTLLDIGLGNGLRNQLSVALSNNENVEARKLVSTAYYCNFLFVLIILFSFCIISSFFSWGYILNAEKQQYQEIQTLVYVVFISFTVNFFFSLIKSVLYAFQLPVISSVIDLGSQLLSFLCVLCMVKLLNIKSLLVLGCTISIFPLIIYIISSFILYNSLLLYVKPNVHLIDRRKIKDLLSTGVKFFIIQIITIVLFQSNNLIITRLLGNDNVVEYNIIYKYTTSILIVFTLLVTPLWSSATEAYCKGEIEWIKKTIKKLWRIVLTLSLLGIMLAIFYKPIFQFWLHDSEFKVNSINVIILLFYSMAMMVYQMYGSVINGIGKLKLQLRITFILAILYIPLCIVLSKFFSLSGILITFSSVAIVNACWSYLQFKKLINFNAVGIWNQ